MAAHAFSSPMSAQICKVVSPPLSTIPVSAPASHKATTPSSDPRAAAMMSVDVGAGGSPMAHEHAEEADEPDFHFGALRIFSLRTYSGSRFAGEMNVLCRVYSAAAASLAPPILETDLRAVS